MNKENKICTLCLTNTKNYKVVNENTVCDSCYNELFRLSKSKQLKIEQVYNKYGNTIRQFRKNEINK